MTASALIPAAGRGERLGRGANKVFATVAGRPILAHTLSVFESGAAVEEIILVVGEREVETAGDLVGRFGFAKVRDVVVGGAHRQDSVRRGLEKVSSNIVAIHDAARPLVTAQIIEQSIAEARRDGACIAAIPVIDTVKSASSEALVTETLDRGNLFAVQTPQTFRTDLIRRAYERAYADGFYATDDAALVERIGENVCIVPGSPDNIKITTPADLQFASMKLGGGETRTGLGLDVHALVEGRKRILGGVEIDFEKGLAGHSDADVVLHAIADACLGAAALGDIGTHFPDTDPAYKDISSLKLLAQVAQMLSEQGWQVVNVDVVVVCQRPKIAGHVPEMIRGISQCIGAEPSRVSVKATTTEHLGFAGRGEGIACYAIATVARP